MLNVFKPFKVGNSDTTTIAKHIGKEADTSPQEDILGPSGSGSICSLDDKFAVEFLSIVGVDCLLKSGRDKNIAKLGRFYHY